MLNKSFGVIYFHFNIFSEKNSKKQVLKFAFLGFEDLSQVVPFHTTHDFKFQNETNSHRKVCFGIV